MTEDTEDLAALNARYHAENVAQCNAKMRASGMCHGRGGDHLARAAYMWYCGPGRNELPLCEACCESWRRNSTGPDAYLDPPHRVTTL